jgi:hypothetical protein
MGVFGDDPQGGASTVVSVLRVYYRGQGLWVFRELFEPTNKYGEVSFPTQVRYDNFYCFLATYYYCGSDHIVACTVPSILNPFKSMGYDFSAASRRV